MNKGQDMNNAGIFLAPSPRKNHREYQDAARERENDERRERRSLTLFHTRGLGKAVFHVMVPLPYRLYL
jgi:hypothetical protein